MTAALHENMSRADYDALPGVNFSTLKHIERSPKHYRHELEHPRTDTAALRLGRATHAAILEPDVFEKHWTTWDGVRRGKAYDQFCLEHDPGYVLKLEEMAEVVAMQKAVLNDPNAAPLLHAIQATEAVITWTDEATGIACKVRLDGLGEREIVELKTTRDPAPWRFGADAARLEYHTQAAWQQHAVAELRGEMLEHFIIAVEHEGPNDVAVYRSTNVLEAGNARYRSWLDCLADCRGADKWPGVAEGGVLDLELPAWATAPEVELTIDGVPI